MWIGEMQLPQLFVRMKRRCWYVKIVLVLSQLDRRERGTRALLSCSTFYIMN